VAEVRLVDGFTVDGGHGVTGHSAACGEGCPDAGDGGEAEYDASSLDH
jgi:hypothetical protein